MAEKTPNSRDESGKSGGKDDQKVLSLSDAMRTVKDRQASRQDVVIDMKEAELARIDLLGEALEKVASELPADNPQFEFAISRGEPPRLWVDMTTFVAMGSDKRTYRLLKDTRAGRTVLAESGDRDRMAQAVAEYVAAQILEREKWLEGERYAVGSRLDDREQDMPAKPEKKPSRFVWFLLGLIAGMASLLAYAWFKVPGAL